MNSPTSRPRFGTSTDATMALATLDRRQLLTATVALAGVAVLPRRTQAQTPDATPAEGAWEFTDDRGITVSFPQRPTSVIAQTSSAAGLWDYGFQVAGIFGPSRTESGDPDAQTGNLDLDQVEILGNYGEIDLEQVIALGAELYVDLDRGTGTLWYDPTSNAPEFESLVQSIGILASSVSVTQTIDRFADLAAALGADLNAPSVVADREALNAALADLRAAIVSKPGLRVLVTAGDPSTGTFICNPAVIPDLLTYTELGLGIVAPTSPDPTTGNNFENRSWEEIGFYPADVILVDSRSDISILEADGLWQNLPAVQAGQVGQWEGTFPLVW